MSTVYILSIILILMLLMLYTFPCSHFHFIVKYIFIHDIILIGSLNIFVDLFCQSIFTALVAGHRLLFLRGLLFASRLKALGSFGFANKFQNFFIAYFYFLKLPSSKTQKTFFYVCVWVSLSVKLFSNDCAKMA